MAEIEQIVICSLCGSLDTRLSLENLDLDTCLVCGHPRQMKPYVAVDEMGR